jgi:hypothetical protein
MPNRIRRGRLLVEASGGDLANLDCGTMASGCIPGKLHAEIQLYLRTPLSVLKPARDYSFSCTLGGGVKC